MIRSYEEEEIRFDLALTVVNTLLPEQTEREAFITVLAHSLGLGSPQMDALTPVYDEYDVPGDMNDPKNEACP